MYLLDKEPPSYYNEINKNNKNELNKKNHNEILELIYALSFFSIICFGLYNIISFMHVYIEYNNMIIYNEKNEKDIEFKKVSYNPIIMMMIFNMILNMLYYMFTNIIIHKNITGVRYYVFSCIICVIIILGIICIIHHNILNKINEYMNNIVMLDSANYYSLLKHIRISTILYFMSYSINIVIVIFLF